MFSYNADKCSSESHLQKQLLQQQQLRLSSSLLLNRPARLKPWLHVYCGTQQFATKFLLQLFNVLFYM